MDILDSMTGTRPGGWRRLNGCACIYCNGTVWKEEASEGKGDTTTAVAPALPLSPSPSEGSMRFYQICDELKDLHRRKSAEYGTPEDPLANFTAMEEWGQPAWVGAMMAASDARQRVVSYWRNGRTYSEGMDNALRDMASFAIIALLKWEDSQYPPGKVVHFGP